MVTGPHRIHHECGILPRGPGLGGAERGCARGRLGTAQAYRYPTHFQLSPTTAYTATLALAANAQPPHPGLAYAAKLQCGAGANSREGAPGPTTHSPKQITATKAHHCGNAAPAPHARANRPRIAPPNTRSRTTITPSNMSCCTSTPGHAWGHANAAAARLAQPQPGAAAHPAVKGDGLKRSGTHTPAPPAASAPGPLAPCKIHCLPVHVGDQRPHTAASAGCRRRRDPHDKLPAVGVKRKNMCGLSVWLPYDAHAQKRGK
jgi:hypothetical protein